MMFGVVCCQSKGAESWEEIDLRKAAGISKTFAWFYVLDFRLLTSGTSSD